MLILHIHFFLCVCVCVRLYTSGHTIPFASLLLRLAYESLIYYLTTFHLRSIILVELSLRYIQIASLREANHKIKYANAFLGINLSQLLIELIPTPTIWVAQKTVVYFVLPALIQGRDFDSAKLNWEARWVLWQNTQKKIFLMCSLTMVMAVACTKFLTECEHTLPRK